MLILNIIIKIVNSPLLLYCVMAITNKHCVPKHNFKVNWTSLKQVQVFKYLVTLTADRECIKEVTFRGI